MELGNEKDKLLTKNVKKLCLPSKDKQLDYDYFMSLMTEKIKNDLSKEVRKRRLREKNNIIRESFNEAKELLNQAMLEDSI